MTQYLHLSSRAGAFLLQATLCLHVPAQPVGPATLRPKDATTLVHTAPAAGVRSGTITDKPHGALLLRRITDIVPAVGSPATQVRLTALLPFVAPTAVRFGALPAAYFSKNADGSITAGAPYAGVAGTSVRVTVVDGGATIASDGLFSYPISHMEVTGPLPMNTAEVGSASWASGHDHMLVDRTSPVLSYSEPPVFHVSVGFVDDSSVHPASYSAPYTVGDYGDFRAHLQNCDITRPPTSTATSCSNWDGNVGSWVDATRDVSTRVTNHPPTPSQSGDLALTTDGVFDQANLVRTLRIVLWEQENDSHHSLIDRVDGKTTKPFIAVVAPSAFIQVKVMPFTIVYQPPGDASTASYQTTASYSTSFKLGNSTDQNNASTAQQTATTKASIKLTLPLATGSSASFGADLGESWDQSTKLGFGTSDSATDTSTATLAFQTGWTIAADPDLVPGSGATCASATDCSTLASPVSNRAIEPFWADTFVFLVHPQFAVWALDAGKGRYVLTAAVPVTADATVAQLAACWLGSDHWPGTPPCDLRYSHSILQSKDGKPVVYTGAADHVTLTPDEAHRFLLLDPFFRDGQAADLPASRAVLLASPAYGARIGERPRPTTLNLNRTLAQSADRSGSTSTTLSITSVRGSDTSFNVGESLFGVIGLTGTQSNGTKSTTSSDLKATYSTSTVMTSTDATQAQVTLNDLDTTSGGCTLPHCHLPLPDRPSVNIYLDKTFGGFMFQDPAAGASHADTLSAGVMRARVDLAVAAVSGGSARAAQPVLDASRIQAVSKQALTQLIHH